LERKKTSKQQQQQQQQRFSDTAATFGLQLKYISPDPRLLFGSVLFDFFKAVAFGANSAGVFKNNPGRIGRVLLMMSSIN